MRIVISALLAASAIFASFSAWAQSADVEGTITDVSTAEMTISLNDGQVYQAPSEFNFDGLESGVKVLVFYTEVNGRRMINDLELVE